MVKINPEDWTDPKIVKAVKVVWMKMQVQSISGLLILIVRLMIVLISITEPQNGTKNVTHVWNADERNVFRAVVGVKLFKSSDVISKDAQHVSDAYFLTGEYKEHDTKLIKYEPTKETYDMFYWDQGYGKLNYQKLRERFPAIKLVHGETHLEVHKRLREQSRTEFYYLILPNTEIFDTFNFDYSFEFGLDKENQKVVVW